MCVCPCVSASMRAYVCVLCLARGLQVRSRIPCLPPLGAWGALSNTHARSQCHDKHDRSLSLVFICCEQHGCVLRDACTNSKNRIAPGDCAAIVIVI